MPDVPMHKRPDSCYVCGWPESDHTGKRCQFWSNADAAAEFAAEDARTRVRYSNGETTPEGNYVQQTRGR